MSDTRTTIHDERPRPWSWFDNAVIQQYGPEIGPYGIAVYMALLTYVDQQRQCFPSLTTLGKVLGISRRKVVSTLKLLAEKHLIRIEQRQLSLDDEPRRYTSNRYTIVSPWVIELEDTPPPPPSAPDALPGAPHALTPSAPQVLPGAPHALTPSAPQVLPGAPRAPEQESLNQTHPLEPDAVKETTAGEAIASPRSASSPAEAADAPPAVPPPSPAAERPAKKPRKLPLRQQPGELHPELIALIQSMSCSAFHCLAEPNQLIERFWDAQIDLVHRVKLLTLEAIVRECDAWYAARPKKWPLSLDGAMRRMQYSIHLQLERAQRAHPRRL